jgi:hypothetical protein
VEVQSQGMIHIRHALSGALTPHKAQAQNADAQPNERKALSRAPQEFGDIHDSMIHQPIQIFGFKICVPLKI